MKLQDVYNKKEIDTLSQEFNRLSAEKKKAIKNNAKKIKAVIANISNLFDIANQTGEPIEKVVLRIKMAYVIAVEVKFFDDENFYGTAQLCDYDESIAAPMHVLATTKLTLKESNVISDILNSFDTFIASLYDNESETIVEIELL